MILVGQMVEGSDGRERSKGIWSRPLDEDRDAPGFELRHDLTKGPRAGCVEDLHIGQAQHDDAYVGYRSELGEEALRGAEEECAVESVGDDAAMSQRGRFVGVDLDGDVLGGYRSAACDAAEGEDRGD